MRKLRGGVAGRLVEVTTRTIQGRYLLCPSVQVNQTILGVIGRAQRRTEMTICAFSFLSNHYHMLLEPECTEQLSSFMQFLNGNVARKVGRLSGWSEKFWSRRYQHILVSDEELAQVRRLEYLLRQGSKEGLVEDPADWPGVTCVAELLRGSRAMHGVWRDGTAEYEARRRGKVLKAEDFLIPETVYLSPIPCWADVSREGRMEAVREIVQRLRRETRERHREAKTRPLGRQAILEQDPHTRPAELKRSPAPAYHAVSPEAYAIQRELDRERTAAYREAAELLKMGVLDAVFPEGCFPPRLPYVREARAGPG